MNFVILFNTDSGSQCVINFSVAIFLQNLAIPKNKKRIRISYSLAILGVFSKTIEIDDGADGTQKFFLKLKRKIALNWSFLKLYYFI